MKALKFVSALLVLSFVLIAAQVKSQSPGKAADKQKQENLEKIKKHQSEMKKKYNSMTPEQKAEAKKKASQYKRNGGKALPEGNGTSAGSGTTKPQAPAVNSKTPEPTKQGTIKKTTHSNKPVWMDEKGKPKPVTPVSTEVGKPETKPSATGKVNTDTKKKVTPKVKTTKEVTKSAATEGVKK